MRNRAVLAGLAMVWLAFAPETASAEDRLRTIAIQIAQPLDHPVVSHRLDAIKQRLDELGWREGKTVRFIMVSSHADPGSRARLAAEMARAKPDVILTDSTAETAAMLRETRDIPIVFGSASDPIGSGFLRSLERPEGNVTGFAEYNPAMSVKWVELLLEIAPNTTDVAVVFNPATAPAAGESFLAAMRVGTRDLPVKIVPAPVSSGPQIEAVIAALGQKPGSGLIFLPDSFTFFHARTAAHAAARHKVPAIYSHEAFVREGGLMSYNAGREDNGIHIADYANLILRGAKVSELPVQVSRRFELVLNLRAAAALGMTPPASLRVRATRTVE